MSPLERNVYRASRNETLKERDYIVSAEEKGKAEGKAERDIEIAKNLLLAGLSVDVIAGSTGLSISQIEALKSS